MIKIITVFVLVFGVLVGLYLLEQKTQLSSRANPQENPKQLLISNISDRSFTISWITDNETIGYVNYSNSEVLDKVALDDRDIQAALKRKTHYVTIDNLEPNTTYFFKVGSNEKVYSDGVDPLQQTTYKQLTIPPQTPELIFGKVFTSTNNLVEDVMIYTKINKGPLMSTLSGRGNWLLNLSDARDPISGEYLEIKNDYFLDIFAQGEIAAGYTPWAVQYKDKEIRIKLEYDEVPFYKISLGADPQVGNSIDVATIENNELQGGNKQNEKSSSFFGRFIELLKSLFTI